MHFKNGISEYVLPPEVDFLHSWANFQADRLYKSNDNVVASRHIKREEVLLPVAVRHSNA